MASENPIKHKDIIQEGNPFDETIKGLESMLKLFGKLEKEMKTTAKQLLEFTKKQNVASKEGKKNIQAAAKATQQLTEKEKEAIRIKKAIAKEQAKLSQLNSKEALQLARLKEETRKRNAELKKTVQQMDSGKKSTNTWGKALGSFAFKFNALGNIAANALSKITQGLKTAITKFISLEKIVRSTQTTSDKLDRTVGRLEGSFAALNRAIALGDFTNIGTIMREAADAAEDYILALDTLGDTQNALNIQNARSRREVKELQEVYNDTSAAIEDRLTAALAAQEILNDLQAKQERIARETIDAELDKVQSTFRLNAEQIGLFKRFIENYNLLSDAQVTALEKLETKQVETTEGGSKLFRFAARALGVASVEEVKAIGDAEQAMRDFDTMAVELSETLGFDVVPIMGAIVGSNDEARTSIVNSIIAYEDQIGATQRLKNANVAMLGTIRNMAEAENTRKEATSETTDEINDQTDAIEETNNALDIEAAKVDVLKIKFAQLNDIIRGTIGVKKENVKATEDEEESEEDKKISAIEGLGVLSEVSHAFAKDNAEITIGAAILDGIAAVVATWKNAGGFPLGLAAAVAQTAIIGKLIASMKSQKFAEGGSGLLGDSGGVLQGRSHSMGGVNLGDIGEAERGEYFGIVNRNMARKYSDELPMVFDSLNNGAFHEVWNRRRSTPNVVMANDPYNRKIYEAMVNTPVFVPEGKRHERYPDGRQRIING